MKQGPSFSAAYYKRSFMTSSVIVSTCMEHYLEYVSTRLSYIPYANGQQVKS